MNEDQLRRFSKLDRQLKVLHKQLSAFSTAKPDEKTNAVKTKLINKLLHDANECLPKDLRPFEEALRLTDNATLSDSVLVAAQYLACFEEYRDRNSTQRYGKSFWVVEIDSEGERTTKYVSMAAS